MNAPHGRFGKAALARDFVGPGAELAGDLGIGLSRYIAGGIAARWTKYRAADGCPGCSAQGFAVGPLVRYHLVQGTRFDPWLSAGASYRWFRLDSGSQESDFSGADLLNLQVGGDWYLVKNLGLGPVLGFDATVLTTRPDWAGRAALQWSLAAGARVVFDHPGK